MKNLKYSLLIILLFVSFFSTYCQEKEKFQAGFKYFTTYDSTRLYSYGEDTIFRPMLIYFWYPSENATAIKQMKFKQYVDLISMREDFSKTREATDNYNYNFINAYSQFAKSNYKIGENITAQQILDSPVKAYFESSVMEGDFPLIIYAPSNSKTPAQNHMICEQLASEGYYVISVASAGPESIKRNNQAQGALAQVEDMEFILNYFENILKIRYSNLGLMNFSTGGLASTLFQMKHSNVNAIFSMDGSHEYSFYLLISKLNSFDLSKANAPYFLVSNKDTSSIYPYYNLINTSNKFFLRMPKISHNGFVSFWSYFDNCDPDTVKNSYTISYQKICEASVCFFNATLKNDEKSKNELLKLQTNKNEYSKFEKFDNTLATNMLNIYLQQNIDAAILKYENDKTKDNSKPKNELEKSVSFLGWMIIDKDVQSSIKLFSFLKDEFPDSWKALLNLAHSYKINGQTELAMETALKAQKLNSENKEIEDFLIELNKKE